MKPKTIAILAAFVLIAFGFLYFLSGATILVITCTRTQSSEVNCSKQWTWWGYFSKSDEQPVNITVLKRVCYVGGCNFWYDNPEVTQTWAGFYGSQPVDDFLSGKINGFSYPLAGDDTVSMSCVAIPVLSIACSILMFTIWQTVRRKW